MCKVLILLEGLYVRVLANFFSSRSPMLTFSLVSIQTNSTCQFDCIIPTIFRCQNEITRPRYIGICEMLFFHFNSNTYVYFRIMFASTADALHSTRLKINIFWRVEGCRNTGFGDRICLLVSAEWALVKWCCFSKCLTKEWDMIWCTPTLWWTLGTHCPLYNGTNERATY